MKRIVLLTNYFAPEYVGIAPHATELAGELNRLGYEVQVFTAMPSYPTWNIDEKYRGRLFFSENLAGCIVHRNWLLIPPGSIGTLHRLVAETSYVFFQIINVLRNRKSVKKADWVIIFSPYFLQGFTALLLKKLWGKEYIFQVEDIQPDSAVNMGMLVGNNVVFGLLVKLAKRLELLFYDKAAIVSTLTPGMKKNISTKLNGKPKKLITFSCWVDTEEYRMSPLLGQKFRNRFGYGKDELLVTYAGNIGRKQNLDQLIDIARAIEPISGKVKFLIVGEGTYKPGLEKQLAANPTDNLRLLPFQDASGYIELLNGTDLSFISQDEQAVDIFFPSKILKILSCGSPVACLANRVSELYGIIRKSGGGYVYEWHETGLFIDRLASLADNREELEEKRKKAREYARDHFSKQAAFREILPALADGGSF